MGLLIKEKGKKYCYVLAMEVRDYELDCEQIVNNANYLHYLEHTRHKFCNEAGVPFFEMHKQGLDGVVRKVEMVYHTPLRSGDKFNSCLRLERKGPRFIFHQDILKEDGTLSVEALITVVMLRNGKLDRGDEIAKVFSRYL